MNPKTIDHVCSRSVHVFHWRNVGSGKNSISKPQHLLVYMCSSFFAIAKTHTLLIASIWYVYVYVYYGDWVYACELDPLQKFGSDLPVTRRDQIYVSEHSTCERESSQKDDQIERGDSNI